MRRRIIIEPEALQDLEEQFDYLAKHNADAARLFLDSWQETFDDLAAMPSMGARRDFGGPKYPGLRTWPMRGFRKILVFYESMNTELTVLRVLHTSRDIETIFKQANEE
jgi:toxin ParE1/3/4